MRKSKLAISAIISLVITLLQPILPANSVETFTKTFSVKKSDGTSYPDVTVALLGYNYDTELNVVYPAQALTNASGIASIVVPDDPQVGIYGYAAQPPIGDFSHSVYHVQGIEPQLSETFAFRMDPANLVVELKTGVGDAASLGSWVHYPGKYNQDQYNLTASPVLRAGPIPIYVSANISSEQPSALYVEPNGQANQSWDRYGIAADSGRPGKFVIYESKENVTVRPLVAVATSPSNTTPIDKAVLNFGQINLTGQVLTSNGEAISIPNNTRLSVFRASSSGAINPDDEISHESYVANNGNISSSLFSKEPGKYFPVIRSSGNFDIPSFIGDPFWLDGSGGISDSGNQGTYTLTSLSLNLPAASEINLKVQLTDPLNRGTLPEGAIDLNGSQGSSWFYWGPGYASNLKAAFAVGDGTYNLFTQLFENSNETIGRQYSITVTNAVPVVKNTWGNFTKNADGVFVLPVGTSNLDLKIAAPVEGAQVPNTQVDIIDPNNQNDSHVGDSWTNQNSQVRMEIPVGNFELALKPEAGNFARTKYLVSNDGNQVIVKDLSGNPLTKVNGTYVLALGLSNVAGSVLQPGSNSLVTLSNFQGIGVQLQKQNSSGNWDWIDNRAEVRDGLFSLAVLEDGTYRLRLEPWNFTDYVATTSSTFAIENGVSSLGTNMEIHMNLPSLRGIVKTPSGSSVVRDSQVIAVNEATGQEMWDNSSNSSETGVWSMSLPEGKYSIVARAPWGNADFGASAPIKGVIVDAQGRATLPGGVSQLELRLQLPTWSGLTVDPTAENRTLADVQICLDHQEANANQTSTCVQSNETGRWAMGKPEGFTDFNDSSVLMIRENWNPQFAEARFTGEQEIEAELGAYSNSSTGPFTGIRVSPMAPNAELLIKKTDGSGAPNVWVSVDREGFFTGGMSDANGLVKLFIPEVELGFKVNAHVDSNPVLAESYTTTIKTFNNPTTVNGIFEGSIELETPNFQAMVKTPNGSTTIQGSWVEIFDEDTQEWLGGNSSLANGNVSLKIPLPSSGTKNYRVNVRPNWNSSGFAPRSYFVVANSAGIQTVRAEDAISGDLISPISGKYTLTVAEPSVRGKVTLPDGTTAVRDSWVNVVNRSNGYDEWLEGASSILDGTFSLAMPAGTYEIFANAPWNSTTFAKSSRCSVVIGENGQQTGTTCTQSDLRVLLKLNAPNLKFNLKKNTGTTVANANVSISIGEWHTWAQSGRDGSVALFIDEQEVRRNNPLFLNSGSLPIRVNIDPPYGASDITRYECEASTIAPPGSQQICSELAAFNFEASSGYVDRGEVIDFIFAAPNSKVTVVLPDLTETLSDNQVAGRDAWVSLFVEEQGGWRNWIGGAQTNANGEALFNIDTVLYADKIFSIEVNAPWNQRQVFASKLYKGITLQSLLDSNMKLSLQEPNLKLQVLRASSPLASRWNWVELEELNSDYSHKAWLDGSGTDDRGRVSLNLPDGLVRLTVHPGPGADGVRTSCIFRVTNSVVAKDGNNCDGQTAEIIQGAMDFKLSLGNVTGRVIDSGNANMATNGIRGAIVYAQAYQLDETTEIAGMFEQTISLPDGSFGLQLDPGVIWKIKVIYVAPEGQQDFESSAQQTVGDLAGAIAFGNISLQRAN